MLRKFPVILFSFCILSMVGCSGGGNSIFSDDRYDDRYNDDYHHRHPGSYGYYDRNDRERERIREERRELERERERLERQRQRERERRRDRESKQRREEHCPSGYRPGRCSDKDRKKHGCKDMRLPGGLGCRSS